MGFHNGQIGHTVLDYRNPGHFEMPEDYKVCTSCLPSSCIPSIRGGGDK